MPNATLKWCGVLALGLGLSVGVSLDSRTVDAQAPSVAPAPAASHAPSALPADAQKKLVQDYCVGCHDDAQLTGGVSFQTFTSAAAVDPVLAAKMVHKLKTGQ